MQSGRKNQIPFDLRKKMKMEKKSVPFRLNFFSFCDGTAVRNSRRLAQLFL